MDLPKVQSNPGLRLANAFSVSLLVMQTEEPHGQGVALRFVEHGQEIGAAHEQQRRSALVQEVDGVRSFGGCCLSLGPALLLDQLRNFGRQLRFQGTFFRVSETKIGKDIAAAAFGLLVVRSQFVSKSPDATALRY